jgi:hypothetical protein
MLAQYMSSGTADLAWELSTVKMPAGLFIAEPSINTKSTMEVYRTSFFVADWR